MVGSSIKEVAVGSAVVVVDSASELSPQAATARLITTKQVRIRFLMEATFREKAER